MAIYRGPGGPSDAVNDSSSETRLAVEARDAAIAAQIAAESAATAATAAKTNAETAETNAETAETNAATSATSAANSASTATTKASEASTSATNASTSASAAATSATSASSSASSASTSASNASTSATNAASSASSASTSATNAASSASSASTSASTATIKASEASTSATNAANSASSASTSASTATTQAGIATTQATNAANSASAASTSASNAATSETNAANSASSASSSASSASSSASNASSSASSAATSASNAAASYDAFDDRYLGSKSSDPSVDNDGNALLTGALYYNTTVPEMRVWDGAGWVFIGTTASSGVTSFNSRYGAVTLTSGDVTTALTYTPLAPSAIGTTVQAYDAQLSDVAGLTPIDNGVVIGNGTNFVVESGSTLRSSLGLAIGTDVQAYDADLTAFAGKTAPTGAVVGTSDTQTLTNKTISVDDNTVSGIAASSFVLSNASGNIDGAAVQKAIPAGVVVGTTDSQTLTNKTISGSSNTLSNIGNSSLTNSAITINGTSTSLGGSISVGTVTSVAALTLGTTGTDVSSTVATGTTTPVITLNIPTSSASNRGALSSTDWSTFNNKQAALVSGTNIKTVSGTSLLGSGDLGTIGATYGGTGQSSYAVGDLLYASTTTALSKLADVATGNALISGGVGVAPAWGKVGLTTHVSGTLPIANGGTNSTATPTNGGVGYGTGTAHAYTSAGTSGQFLQSNGAAAPSWATGELVEVTTGSPLYYGARAWVNFNGTGTVAIRTSVNVSSITDNGTGDYTVNFTTAMPDANYSFVGLGKDGTGTGRVIYSRLADTITSSACQIRSRDGATSTASDTTYAYVAFFR